MVCVGDSLTEGYPITLNELSWPAKLNTLLGPIWQVRNSGIRAYTIALLTPVAASLFSSVGSAADGVRLAILQAGTNDLVAGRTPTQMMTDMEALVDEAISAGWTPFVVTVPPAVNGFFNETDRQTYNTSLRATKAGASRLIDWAADTRLDDPNDSTYFWSGDKIHFTEAGNDACAELAQTQMTAEFGTIYGRGFKLR